MPLLVLLVARSTASFMFLVWALTAKSQAVSWISVSLRKACHRQVLVYMSCNRTRTNTLGVSHSVAISAAQLLPVLCRKRGVQLGYVCRAPVLVCHMCVCAGQMLLLLPRPTHVCQAPTATNGSIGQPWFAFACLAMAASLWGVYWFFQTAVCVRALTSLVAPGIEPVLGACVDTSTCWQQCLLPCECVCAHTHDQEL